MHGTALTVCSARKCDAKHLTSVLRGELDWIVLKALEKDRSRQAEACRVRLDPEVGLRGASQGADE